ncbi:MAG TPA: AidA/PixA family protein [Aliidongia sp.]|nr:AidA/PixA family protein [Aliidongia sp.]
MPDIVSVGIVIDTQTILATHPHPSRDPDRPTFVAHDTCYMIGQSAYVSDGQATAHLQIEVPDLLPIRWRSLSLSGNAGQSAVLYHIHKHEPRSMLSPIAAIEVPCELPLPILVDGFNTDPPSFSAVPSQLYFLEARIERAGTERLHVQFYVTVDDDSNGQPAIAGCFDWHARLTVAVGQGRSMPTTS